MVVMRAILSAKPLRPRHRSRVVVTTVQLMQRSIAVKLARGQPNGRTATASFLQHQVSPGPQIPQARLVTGRDPPNPGRFTPEQYEAAYYADITTPSPPVLAHT